MVKPRKEKKERKQADEGCGRLLLFQMVAITALCILALLTVMESNTKAHYFRQILPQSDGAIKITRTTPDHCSDTMEKMNSFFDSRRKARLNQQHSNKVDKKVFFDFYEPDAVCLREERFGTLPNLDRHEAFGDGPKFVCGVDHLAAKAKKANNNLDNNDGEEVSASCLVYSVGSNNDVQFEESVQRFLSGCEVHTFDPTVKVENFVGHNVTNFHEWGLGVEGKEVSFQTTSFTSKSLETVVKDLGHENRAIDMLKIDCEGCEWTVMPKVFEAIASGRLVVHQVLIELHQNDDRNLALFLETADKAGMRTFHKERNHWGCMGFNCVEYSLVSEEWLTEVNRQDLCSVE